ncbi:MAG: hypothetical protein AB8B69_24065 [Chitinophagales bacterium]
MMKNNLHRYSPEEIEIVNIIEELQHFQRLIDIGEDECKTFNEPPDFELKQYYQKRQRLYHNLLDSILNLQFRTPKTNEILQKLLERLDIQLPKKKTAAIDKDLEQVATLLAS